MICLPPVTEPGVWKWGRYTKNRTYRRPSTSAVVRVWGRIWGSSLPPEKKLNLGLAEMQFPSDLRDYLHSSVSSYIVDFLSRFQFLPPLTPTHPISMQIWTNYETHKWGCVPPSPRGSASVSPCHQLRLQLLVVDRRCSVRRGLSPARGNQLQSYIFLYDKSTSELVTFWMPGSGISWDCCDRRWCSLCNVWQSFRYRLLAKV